MTVSATLATLWPQPVTGGKKVADEPGRFRKDPTEEAFYEDPAFHLTLTFLLPVL